MFDPHTLLLLAALAAPPDSSARLPSATDSVLASLVSPLVRPGERVRVSMRFAVAEGQIGSVAPRGVLLRRDEFAGRNRPYGEPIAWAQIERIERGTASAKTGATVGAAIGGLLGLATVASAASYANAYSGGTAGDGVLFATVVGGVAGVCVGGFAGGIVGALLSSWKTVYERR